MIEWNFYTLPDDFYTILILQSLQIGRDLVFEITRKCFANICDFYDGDLQQKKLFVLARARTRKYFAVRKFLASREFRVSRDILDFPRISRAKIFHPIASLPVAGDFWPAKSAKYHTDAGHFDWNATINRPSFHPSRLRSIGW